MTNNLLYIGLTHQSTPLAIRENLRVDAEKLRTLLSRLGEVADGRIVLSTCERFEVYATTRHLSPEVWTTMLSQWFHVPAAMLSPHVRVLEEWVAAEHLLRVAAGLESRILGENQILRQVRDAIETAREMNALDAQLFTLARTALRAGKRVRGETALGAGSRSIAALALDALSVAVETPANMNIAVVGTGRLAEVVLHECKKRTMGVTLEPLSPLGERLGEAWLAAARQPSPQPSPWQGEGAQGRINAHTTIVGRDRTRLAELSARFDVHSAEMNELASIVDRADAVIVCTAAPAPVLDTCNVSARNDRPLFLFDLSVPRNIDPILAHFPDIRLVHMDQLVGASIDNRPSPITNLPPPVVPAWVRTPTGREGPVASHSSSAGEAWPVASAPGSERAHADRIIAEELDRFRTWRRERAATKAIARLVRDSQGGDRHLLHQRIQQVKAEAAA